MCGSADLVLRWWGVRRAGSRSVKGNKGATAQRVLHGVARDRRSSGESRFSVATIT